MRSLSKAMVVLFIVGSAVFAKAQAPVSDPFDTGADNVLLDGFGGGAGFGVNNWASGGGTDPRHLVGAPAPAFAFPANVQAVFGAPSPGHIQSQAVNAWKTATRAIDPAIVNVDLSNDGYYYMSFLGYVDAPTSCNGCFSLYKDGSNKIEPGWWPDNALGSVFTVNVSGAGTYRSAVALQALTPYFFVMKLEARAASGLDKAYLKVYDTTQTVHSSPLKLSGQGADADNWTMITPGFNYSGLFNTLQPAFNIATDATPVPNPRMDEVRLGTTWEQVTGLAGFDAMITSPSENTTYYAATIPVDIAATSTLGIVDVSLMDGPTSVATATLVSGNANGGMWHADYVNPFGGKRMLGALITDASGTTGIVPAIAVYSILPQRGDWFVVNADPGAGTTDGSSWANATNLTAAAISANYWGGGRIFISSGTHAISQEAPITTAVQAYGGFMGNEPEAGVPGNRFATFLADSPTTISGGGVTRILNIANAGEVLLDGIGIADGYHTGGAYGGGAIYAIGTQLTFNQCALYNNISNALPGGALRADIGCDVTMTGCVASSNTTLNQAGGALSFNGSTATLTGCSFSSNSATGTAIGVGGAVNTEKSPLTIDQCSFYGNASFQNNANGGGAIYASNAAPIQPIVITRTDFTSNVVAYNGGAMNIYGNTTLTSCTFVGNRSSNGVGAIRLNNPWTLVATACRFEGNWSGTGSAGVILVRNDNSHTTFTRCLFLGNSTLGDGGAIYLWHSGTSDGADSQVTAINCVFADNKAGGSSGAIHSYYNSQGVRAINCTFVNNQAGGNGTDGVYVNSGAGPARNLFLNCIFDGHRVAVTVRGGGSNATFYNCLRGLNGPNALLNGQVFGGGMGDPKFVDAAAGDYRLQNSSPAIGAGAAAGGGLAAPEDDIEGTLRGTPVDMGAYENSLDIPVPAGAPAQDVRYAKPAATGLGDGSSWDNAATLTDAIATVAAGGVVLVSSGTHPLAAPIAIDKSISIYGGCLGDETTPTARHANFMELYPTTATATAQTRVFVADAVADLTLDGVNVSDGYTSPGAGGGLYVNVANTLTVRNCAFDGNMAAVDGGGAIGVSSGVMYLTLDNCAFTSNCAAGAGVGGGGAVMAVNASSVTATNLTFTSNSTTYAAGAFRIVTSVQSYLKNCVFVSNYCYGPNSSGALWMETDNGQTFDDCVFEGNYALSNRGGVMFIQKGATALNNCSLTSNRAGNGEGGALINAAGAMSLTGCSLTNNTSTGNGGAISCLGGSLTLTTCTLRGNYASANNGGAIYNNSSAGTMVTDCVFYNNYTLGAYEGGAIYNNAGPLTAIACEFSSNTANTQGGAIRHGPGTVLTLDRCIVTSNSTRQLVTGSGGGAIYGPGTNGRLYFTDCVFTQNVGRQGGVWRADSTLTAIIDRCIFDSNKAGINAGAIVLTNAAENLTVTNSIFVNNEVLSLAGSGAGNGGAVHSDGQLPISFSNCLFYGNRSWQGDGGAINIVRIGGLNLTNCTFANNRVSGGAKLTDGVNLKTGDASKFTILNCIFDGHRVAIDSDAANGIRGNVYHCAFGNQAANATIDVALSDCVYGDLAFVNPEAGDYRLQNHSVAIGAGALTGGGLTAPAADLDGVTRPLPAGSNPDIGCYENALRGTPDTPPAIPTVYVTATGAGTMDGSSWDNATTITPAIDLVTTGGRIFMKGGAGETHLLSASLTTSKSMSIYGGFAGLPTEDDPSKRQPDYLANYPTTIDGQNLYRIFTLTYAGPVTLDALIMTDGYANTGYGGGGVCIENSSLFTLRDCTISNCIATNESGGIRIAWGLVNITSSTITGNKTNVGRGGGISFAAASGLIENSVISNNECYRTNNGSDKAAGGGISAYLLSGGTLTIRNSHIIGNWTHDNGGGGGMHVYDGGLKATLIMENCEIADNRIIEGGAAKDQYGAGFYATDSVIIQMTNCDIVRNINVISGGSQTLGGGMNISGNNSSNPKRFNEITLTNCRINDNYAWNNNTGDPYGGGIFLRQAGCKLTAINCQINRNATHNTGASGSSNNDFAYGGGIAVLDNGTELTLIGCEINDNVTSVGNSGNTGNPEGGGIYIRDNTTAQITSCVVMRNVAFGYRTDKYGTAGGIQLRGGGSFTMTNCLVANNSSEYAGGGLRASNITAACVFEMVNCTFYNNAVTNNDQGQGVYLNNELTVAPAIVNCLFDGHTLEALRVSDSSYTTTPLVYNSLFGTDGANGQVVNAACLVNCITGLASGLADPLNDNYNLALGSAAIDAGLTQADADTVFGAGLITVPAEDLVGRSRLYPAPAIPDIGAYEMLRIGAILTPDPFHFGIVDAGSSVTSAILIANTGNVALNFDAAKWAASGAPFSVVTPFGGEVAPGATASIDLGFAPAALGDYTGELGYSDLALAITSATLRGATPVSVISITKMDSDPTSAGAVQYLVTFSQPVLNADPADFDVATTGAFTVAPMVLSVIPAGATVIVTVNTGLGDGQIQLILNAASDIAEATYLTPLVNKPFAGEIYTLDNAAPVIVSIIPRDGAVLPTSASSVIYDVTFSEAVSGVTQANFAFIALDAFASGSITNVGNAGGTPSATVWQVTVGNLISSNATGGFLQLNLTDPAGVLDNLGNPMTATAVGDAIWVDRVGPAFDPMADVDPTSGSVVGIVAATTITFSEAVTGVTADKLAITTDGVTILTPTSVANPGGDQMTYAFAIDDVYGSGPVALNMTLYGTSGTTILDAAGNPFTLAQWSITKDVSVVQVAIASAQVAIGGLTSLTQVTFHAHFQVAVAGFDPETQPTDLQLSNCAYVSGTLSGSGTDYDFAVSPLGEGAATVRIPAGVCQTSGLPTRSNGTSNLYDLIFDQTPPGFTLLSVIPARAQVGTTVTLSLMASENLMANPLVSVNAHAAAFASKAGNNYTYTYVIVSGDPETTASIAMTGADLAGNTSTTVDNTALYVDKTAPVATIEPVSPDGGALVTVDFSEDVTGVDVTDFILTKNGAPIAGITNFTVVNGRQCTFNVPNAAPGLYVLRLQAAGSNIRDLAGIALAADATDTWTVAEGAAAVELWSRY